jgi:hypothetical protein
VKQARIIVSAMLCCLESMSPLGFNHKKVSERVEFRRLSRLSLQFINLILCSELTPIEAQDFLSSATMPVFASLALQ